MNKLDCLSHLADTFNHKFQRTKGSFQINTAKMFYKEALNELCSILSLLKSEQPGQKNDSSLKLKQSPTYATTLI